VSFCFCYACCYRAERSYDPLRRDPLHPVYGRRGLPIALVHPDVGGVVHHWRDHGGEQLPRRRRGQTTEPFQLHRRAEPFGGRSCDMLLIPELGIHDHTKDLDVVFWLNILTLDGEGLGVGFVGLAGKVDDGRLVCFKCRSASLFPV
jgi:hypothetical protein